MKNSAKFIVLHPSSVHTTTKPTTTSQHRAWLALVSLIFLSTFTFTLLTSRHHHTTTSDHIPAAALPPPHLLESLIHYATVNTTGVVNRMSAAEVASVAAVLRSCQTPCNLLVFGFTHETLLWHAMNYKGRTVFVGENAYLVSVIEQKHPFIEAYDVQFTTKVSELYDLIDYYKTEVKKECRPVQNLLFSECKLAINDLPNYVYDVSWDVIIIDGPRGYEPGSPGRISAVYTAAVVARSKKGAGAGEGTTHVFVHEAAREVEKVSADEFLCRENLVETVGELGHYAVVPSGGGDGSVGFCSGRDGSDFSPESI